MFGLVESYSSLGDHRTGTPVDSATSEWMRARLEERGLLVEAQPIAFDDRRIESRVAVDGRQIDHLVVPGGPLGSWSVVDPPVTSFDPASGGFPHLLDEAIAASGVGRGPLLLATDHPNGALVGVNRGLDTTTGEVTAILVGSSRIDALRGGSVEVEVSVSATERTTRNLVARTEGATPGSVMFTTPMNGWFACAGERGTGIAVMLDMIDRMIAAGSEFQVLCTAGHEREWFGAMEWFERSASLPEAIIHFGASIAVESETNGSRALAPTRVAMTDRAGTPEFRRILEDLSFIVRTECSSWIGEGTVWSRCGVPLFSMSGAGVDFHTPDDRPERATSPGALAAVASGLSIAITEFLAECGATMVSDLAIEGGAE